VTAVALARRAAIWPVLAYQRWLSPLKRHPTCRFAPTCSAYAVEAIGHRGVVLGFALAFWRILRCNPLFAGGFDPVPRRRPIEPE
jgi:putative membrane protein insertion efficiency factor